MGTTFIIVFAVVVLLIPVIGMAGISRPSWYVWLQAKALGRKLVWLKCSEGEVVLSNCWTDPWGDVKAKWSNVRTVKLREDGTVDGSYVKFWKPYK